MKEIIVPMQIDFDGLTLVDKAIMRLKEFEPPEGYYLAFSGGKDSIVIYDLAVKSGVKFDAHYRAGGIDPPELMEFIRTYPMVVWDKSEKPFWKQLMSDGLPQRNQRWCCELIKEAGGIGRSVVTGIRWEESTSRARRKMVESCTRANKRFINPIIDWSSAEVWNYIKCNGIKYCSLYDEGFTRLGCVLCPMAGKYETQMQIQRFPKLVQVWKKAAERYFNRETKGGSRMRESYGTFENYWVWWISREGKNDLEGQCQMTLDGDE